MWVIMQELEGGGSNEEGEKNLRPTAALTPFLSHTQSSYAPGSGRDNNLHRVKKSIFICEHVNIHLTKQSAFIRVSYQIHVVCVL